MTRHLALSEHAAPGSGERIHLRETPPDLAAILTPGYSKQDEWRNGGFSWRSGETWEDGLRRREMVAPTSLEAF